MTDILDLGSWCILRTSAASTLRLAETLNEAGFEAWVPVETVLLRARRGHKRKEIAGPIMPGYVFAKNSALIDLLEMERSPSLLYSVWDAELRRMVTKGHPMFRVMRDPGGQPARSPETHLAHLRHLDGLRRPKGPVRQWAAGEAVRLTDGAYAGLRGVVVKFMGSKTTISINGWAFQPTVSTRLLHPVLDDVTDSDVSSGQATMAEAA